MREEKQVRFKDLPEVHQTIFKKMFKSVGGNAETFDFNVPEWFYAYYWDDATEAKFRYWLKKKVAKTYPFLNEKGIDKEVSYFILMWGWCSEGAKGRVDEWRAKNGFDPATQKVTPKSDDGIKTFLD